MNNLLKRFGAFDLVIIALMAALGVAVKPIVTGLVHIITGPLIMPGGSLAGGFYMLWLVLGAALVKKPGTAALIGLVQSIMVIVTGFYGTHGIVSLVTYTLPGLTVDLLYWIARLKADEKMAMFAGCIGANLCGVLLSNLVFFRLPLIPLLFSLSAGALSGALGGLLAWLVAERFSKLNI
ncbi:MAG TPA: ECF transporter S component [Syntrophomonas sp.]|nr:ECF transporter S component [Syntrophomonas sp.]